MLAQQKPTTDIVPRLGSWEVAAFHVTPTRHAYHRQVLGHCSLLAMEHGLCGRWRRRRGRRRLRYMPRALRGVLSGLQDAGGRLSVECVSLSLSFSFFLITRQCGENAAMCSICTALSSGWVPRRRNTSARWTEDSGVGAFLSLFFVVFFFF